MEETSLFFIDFEASSLWGWPIEIGLSWISQGRVETWSSLIRPRSHWSDSAWDPAANRIHGIARKELDLAPLASNVADTYRNIVGGGQVISDAPDYDGAWLEQLLEASFPLENYHEYAAGTFSGAALDYLYERLERSKPPHRAGPDSARLATAWLRALQISRSSQ